MVNEEDEGQLETLLKDELGLTPYESRAYLAVLRHGPLSPQGVNQKSGIPRPRAYDVLNSLLGRGLLAEEPGRPRLYVAVDPRIALERMMGGFEARMLRQIEEKREATRRLTAALSALHTKVGLGILDERVWVTRRDRALVARYAEAIRSIKDGLVIATASAKPAEKETTDAVRDALASGKSVRVVRTISPAWSLAELKLYEDLIELGCQIRCTNYEGLTFTVFDRERVVIWLPPLPSQQTVWISLPSLAAILQDRFEELWEKGSEALPIVKRLMEA